jgi:hypothetical protein
MIDFVGVVQVNELELGNIEINAQSIPAVRFVLKQNRSYPILASGHLAGELYAYCAAALEQGIEGLDVKIACALMLDIHGDSHLIATDISWYSSRELRRQAATGILDVFEKGNRSLFETCDEPFIVMVKSEK